jgi:hypothetical protein
VTNICYNNKGVLDLKILMGGGSLKNVTGLTNGAGGGAGGGVPNVFAD